MNGINAIAHVGITVEDLERSIRFYCDNFGFSLQRRAHFSEAFFEKNESLYRLPPRTTLCDTAILSAPKGGAQLELFRFSDQLSSQEIPWNRRGITHIALEADDVPTLAEELRGNGVEFCIGVGVRPDKGHWLFVRDPDGNLVEVMEPFRY
ncbi:MAG: VOC family protein [Clostridiales bacterium]|nr:VOC family protein [Clostridiales bacterium]